ncbi:MAG: alkene reductase [Oleibacter sp.]|nr:alkene reductase [Thalassolituus sp.]
MSTETSALFEPLKIGDLSLKNRIVLAPLTRCRAIDHMPNALMKEYYTQRASGGLIITECTLVSPNASAFANDPGIYSEEQVAAWKEITDSVHEAGGKIFMQIWHPGRAGHPEINDGEKMVSASAIAIEGSSTTPAGKFEYTQPEALTEKGIKYIIAAFKHGAINAKKAGFDGVEIHCANGYLLDQFLRDGSNHRNDNYGGSWHNRARLLTEVLNEVIDVWGNRHVGIRLSPLNGFNDMKDSDPVALTRYMCAHLNQFDLGYLHIMRADFKGEQKADVIANAHEIYEGNLMVNMGYTPQEAADTIASGTAALVSFGTSFLANPDLPERIKQGADLNTPDPDTFYTSGAEGYTDYPTL